MIALEMLDVAIGIIFVYLLLSLICSALNEFIEGKIKLRAVDLEQGIRELLNDPTGNTVVKSLYSHPLISGLFRGNYDSNQIRVKPNQKDTRYSRGSDLPSYIPAKNFALALMDVMLPATSASQSGSTGAVSPLNANVSLPDSSGNLQPPADLNPLQALRAAVDGLTTNGTNAIANTTNGHIRTALLTIIDAAGDNAAKARESIENWYDSSMDRVSGWYKRRVQTIVFAMGFVIAIVLNADTFAIFSNLANDRPLRNAIVAQAQSFKETKNDNAGSYQVIKGNVDTLLSMGLPIGWRWKSAVNDDAVTNYDAIPASGDIKGWIVKFIGWLATGFAVSLGASFWFDTLNKIMVVRATVKPTEKSPDEGSQD